MHPASPVSPLVWPIGSPEPTTGPGEWHWSPAPGRIVIVEDEPLLARNLGRYLEQQGHAITLAATHREGIACCLRDSPDLIIVDRTLPDGSGVDLIEQVRRSDAHAATIMVTAYWPRDPAEEAARCAADACFIKPLSLVHLGQIVSILLSRRCGTGTS